jgi:hypothetical protein
MDTVLHIEDNLSVIARTSFKAIPVQQLLVVQFFSTWEIFVLTMDAMLYEVSQE